MRCPVHNDHPLAQLEIKDRDSPMMYLLWECPVEGQRWMEVPEGTPPSDPNYVQQAGERQP